MKPDLKSLLLIQKKSLQVVIDSNKKTNIVAVFIDSEFKSNLLMNIPCFQGLAISGYPYDCTSDCYIKECVNYIDLGFLDFSCLLSVHNSFEIRIPICKTLCLKSMSKDQVKMMKTFIKKNGYQELEVEFLQTISDSCQ